LCENLQFILPAAERDTRRSSEVLCGRKQKRLISANKAPIVLLRTYIIVTSAVEQKI